MNKKRTFSKVVHTFFAFFIVIAVIVGAQRANASLFSAISGYFSKKSLVAAADVSNSQNLDVLDPNEARVRSFEVKSEQAEERALIAHDEVIDHAPTAALITTYTVRPGDTISGIAQMFRVSPNTIIWVNDLPKNTIQPGQELVILPVNGITHTVKKGETLSTIAKKYNGDVDEILAFNNIEGALAVGDEIVIPDGEPEKTRSGSATVKAVAKGLMETKGYFTNPLPKGRRTQGLHGNNGVDIAAAVGTPIVAAAQGTVLVTRSDGGWNGGYGNYIVIAHPNGTQTLYAHLSKVSVASGQKVIAGETIGTVGNTGKSTGAHLHFEVRGGKNPF